MTSDCGSPPATARLPPPARSEREELDVAYAYEFDAADIRVQSGRPRAILEQLEQRIRRVVRTFPLRQHLRYVFAPKYLLYKRSGLNYRPDREPAVLRQLARQLERRLRHVPVDCIFAPGSHIAAALNSALPIVFCADATFANVLGSYESFERCAAEFVELGHGLDRRALHNCAAAIYPSEWAAKSAVDQYNADPDKVHVIPFGANVETPARAEVQSWIFGKSFEELRLLFIGREWHRKGGDIVLAACDVLSRRQVRLRVDLVGIRRGPNGTPSFAKFHGLLDKNRPQDRHRLSNLLKRAHFLFVPSRAENYGMVYCEAAAFGLPSIATAVGGVPTIVRNGETGFLLPAGSAPAAYADTIESCLADPQVYVGCALRARHDFEARLNWDAFGTRLVSLLQRVR
jgi:glycosyltransferase involved in cell wall biosynthesis